MACMEHTCQRCDYTVFNNGGAPVRCPKCGGEEFSSYSDELPESPREREEPDDLHD